MFFYGVFMKNEPSLNNFWVVICQHVIIWIIDDSIHRDAYAAYDRERHNYS